VRRGSLKTSCISHLNKARPLEGPDVLREYKCDVSQVKMTNKKRDEGDMDLDTNSRNGEGGKENNGGMNSTKTYFKSFCKCHNVPPVQ
jgi:hypothetical protein